MSSPKSAKDVLLLLQPLFEKARAHVVTCQSGVPTYFNVLLRTVMDKLKAAPDNSEWRQALVPSYHQYMDALYERAKREQLGRFLSWEQRLSSLTADRDVDDQTLAFSQGTLECMHWKGRPVFKTVYEFALYPMVLWELKPATIIELGSGTGSSAIWLLDILRQFDNQAQIVSLDINLPDVTYDGVTFVEGDLFQIEKYVARFRDCPKPWLIIEDAHVNIPGILNCMHDLMESGDYLVIEDSTAKQDPINEFMRANGSSYEVDTRYLDFFGLNTTSALNSVFRRV